jgi:hypothetical protein
METKAWLAQIRDQDYNWFCAKERKIRFQSYHQGFGSLVEGLEGQD